MTRRVRSVFAAEIPGPQVTSVGLEYYIRGTDGDNAAVFPPSAPEMPLSLVATESPARKPLGAPGPLTVKDRVLEWVPGTGNAFLYRIYRGREPDFAPGPATLLTYVEGATTRFEDGAPGFDGRPLSGRTYYRISAVDRAGNESGASPAVTSEAGVGE